MKNKWKAAKLSEVCSFLNRGIAPKYLETGGICVLNQRCIRDHRITYEFARRHDLNTKKVDNARFIQAGDVLVNSTGTGTLGRVAQYRVDPLEPTTVDSHITIVRPTPGIFFREFFGYMMREIEDELKESGEGCGGQTELARSVLAEKFTIRYPKDLYEQQRIARILDEAFAGIATAKANAEMNLQSAHSLPESHLKEIFSQRGEGWRQEKLGDLCNIARGGSPRPIQKFLTTAPNGINWIKIGDATASGKYIYRTEEKIIPEGAKRSRIVHSGDFILSNSMSFGRPYIMRTMGCIHDGWLVLSNYEPQLNQNYLYHALSSQFVFYQFDRLAAGSTVRNLNIELASRVNLPIPPLKQQAEIAQRLDAISTETQHLESIYQQKKATLGALKKSLLHQAFSGQL